MLPLHVAFGWPRVRTTFSITHNPRMASSDPSRLMSQWVTPLQDNPRGEGMWPCVTHAIKATVFSKERDIEADLTDADKYLASLTGTAESSIFPPARRRQHAELMGMRARMDATIWSTNRLGGI